MPKPSSLSGLVTLHVGHPAVWLYMLSRNIERGPINLSHEGASCTNTSLGGICLNVVTHCMPEMDDSSYKMIPLNEMCVKSKFVTPSSPT
ncbi:hypothetical protein P171DRAFT_428638 [Karstenula rhodostoma CBS 690.94]|uniref:Uncharacterized protein n=1 Tax=Karstenula rhodostoma CBS 690.94 TaxID=1392251 RepID=A0A9P4UE72_9PLEO|nr:hypothetical protein P171DRAFT_428638 [Karstenula rhodostoma CBS 690.94]